MLRLATLSRLSRESLAALVRLWARFWFQSRPTSPLEIVRIGIGAALLLHYGMATPYLLDFWGDAGWMPLDIVFEDIDSWTQSVFFYFWDPSQWYVFHGLFLLGCAAFMVGWRTSWVKWIVLIGQISYAHRNPMLIYGVDKILASLLLILCLAPIGRAISLDRVRAVRAAKRGNLEAKVPAFSSPWAGACTRLMQIQMAALFFYSGFEKLRGDEWRNGDAIWFVFAHTDFYNRAILDLELSRLMLK